MAIADPNRRAIIDILLDGEKTSTAVAEQLDIAPQTTSQHLKILVEAGLLTVRADATRRIYAVDRSAFKPLLEWVAARA
ncbi:MAG: winged helix-turn-helix transcriptional regulator [Afipia sp.]|nr:winged helix-turn-helix transcriptional regulator [Afipia sp.]